ncbi:MAG: hypothetical protein HY077_11930 [Elusimicrobia bacterium]|nr:hypothetical protein [Elusimicrobiota bacterium]
MRRIISLVLILGSASARAAPKAEAAGAPSFKKVMIVVLENTDYDHALGQPFLGKLARQGALLSGYYAVDHPSQPNYVALVSGDTLGVDSDKNVSLDETNVADLLEAAGKSWKIYAEDYPGRCFLDAKSGLYARKHVPLLSFKDVAGDPARCARIVDAAQMAADLKAGGLPDYSLYIPNLENDGHDTGADYADAWYARVFGPLLDDPAFTKGLLLVTIFDEDENDGGDNRIYASLYGSGVAPGAVSANRYDHYSLLRLVEDGLGVGNLGRRDSSAAAISGVWK